MTLRLRPPDSVGELKQFAAFLATVDNLRSFDEAADAQEAALAEVRKAAVEVWLRSPKVRSEARRVSYKSFDPNIYGLCEEALEAADCVKEAGNAGFLDLTADQRFVQFQDAVGVPAGLLKQRNMTPLRGYIEAKLRAASKETADEKAETLARAEALISIEDEEQVTKVRDTAAAARKESIAIHCGSLAQSDHLPIRVRAQRAGSGMLRVASLYVQAHGPLLCIWPTVQVWGLGCVDTRWRVLKCGWKRVTLTCPRTRRA